MIVTMIMMTSSPWTKIGVAILFGTFFFKIVCKVLFGQAIYLRKKSMRTCKLGQSLADMLGLNFVSVHDTVPVVDGF